MGFRWVEPMNTANIRWFTSTAATAVLLGLSVVGAPVASAQSTPPPTLSGETLTALIVGGGGLQCGSTGPFSFTTSGTATGPYPGTFTETGSGTVNPLGTAFTGSVTATFTIYSATGKVTGTKTFNNGEPL